MRSAAHWLARALGLALGGVFLFAALQKLRDLAAFERALGRFGIVLDELVGVTAVALAVLELATGAGLVLGLRAALAAATGLLLLFLGVLAYGLWLGLDIECGCFGPGDAHTDLGQALQRDLVLLAVCGYLYWRRAALRREDRT